MMVMLTAAPKSTAPISDFALHSAQLSNIKRQQKARFLFLGKDETGLTTRKTKSGVEAMIDPSVALIAGFTIAHIAEKGIKYFFNPWPGFIAGPSFVISAEVAL